MRRHLLATAVLVPAAAAATILPANAQPLQGQWHPVANRGAKVSAASVSNVTLPGAAPIRQLRASTQTCSGTMVYRGYAKANGKAIAELDVYYKTANGGTLITCLKHVGATKGVRTFTGASLVATKSATGKLVAGVAAYGNFVSWAGPAALGGMNGHCAQATGNIEYKGTRYAVASPLMCDS